MANVLEKASLYYRKGSSDKVYFVELREAEGAYDVVVAYGRRGANLATLTKAAGVSEAAGRKTFQAIVREKVAKDYELADSASGTAIAAVTARDGKRALVDLQFLTAISRDDHDLLNCLLDDPLVALMQKHDGDRRLVEISATRQVLGINRKRLYVPLPDSIVASIAALPAGTIIDGEIIGDRYFPFDILAYDGNSRIKEQPFERRHALLEDVIARLPASTNIVFVEPVTDPAAKRRRFEELLASDAEGVVFVFASSPYTVGKSKIAFKFKFYETASVIVTGANEQRSVAMSVYDEHNELVAIGNVTSPLDLDKAALLNAIIEVRYRHINAPGGSLIEPVFLAVRTDIDASECTTEQLYYKTSA